MADQRMQFVLEGRDRLTRVLDRAGDAAARMARRMEDASADSSRAVEGFTRDANGRLHDARGRFVAAGAAAEGMGRSVSRGARRAQMSMRDLKVALLALAPAAVPIAASLVPIAASAGAASVAMLAFTAAVVPQVMEMSKAADAQELYSKAVRQHGPASEQAAKAETEMLASIAKMPRATREAAAALGVFKDTFRAWSDSLASSTMPAFTSSLEATAALLPRLSGVTKGAGIEIQRLMSVAAGGFASPGFDRLMGRFTVFTDGVLRRATDSVVHFFRVLSEGRTTGLQRFMDYAQRVGPQVAEALGNIGRAVGNVLRASADAGLGILQVVSAFAKMVAALPTGFLTLLLQVVAAFKLIKLASAGLLAARAGLVGLTAAGMTAGATMRGLGAAFMALSRTARIALVTSGIGLLVVALGALSSAGKKTPPDVDKLTTSLGKLGKTGKATGEAARAFGKDLGGLADSLRVLARPSNLDSVQQFLTGLIGMDSTPVAEAKEALDGVDKALAGMVKGGNAQLAAAAFDQIAAAMRKKGLTTGEVRKQLDDYRSALADAKFEAQLTAQSMGLFGDQAMKVQAKLDGQKRSADGLRQSIQALNDVNRQGLGGMIGFEAAIDAASKAAGENAGSLRMVNGELDLNSPKAQKAATALNDLAAKTDENTAAARQSGKSWSYVNGVYERGRAELIRSATQMGLTRAEAEKLAGQILKTPNKTAMIKGDIADLKAKIADAKDRLGKVPDSRKASVRADIAQLQRQLDKARRELASLRDKTITVTTFFKQVRQAGGSNQAAKNAWETSRARGGPVPGYASGGHVQAFTAGGFVRGPGTGTSDSILGLFSGGTARVSDQEYVIRAAAVRKYGINLFDQLNQMQVPTRTAAGRPDGGRQVGQQPLIGSLTVNAGSNASADDIIGAAMYGARVARRGGVHG